MNKRIKIYAIILAIVYVCMIVTYLISSIDPFLGGLEEGKARVETQGGQSEIFHINVKPQTGYYSFPAKISDTEQGKSTVFELDRIKVRQLLSVSEGYSVYSIYLGVRIAVSFIILACLVYVPFLFFKIVHAVTKGEIFGVSVVQRIIKIGWIVVAYFIISSFIEVVEVYYAKQFIQMDGYEIAFFMPSFITLILGLIILFLGEVLRVSLSMKEEQDLTI